MQATDEENHDLDKLLHELDMNRHIDDDEFLTFVRQYDCFVCGLTDWVQASADRYAFGAEQCISARLDVVHRATAPIHVAPRLERRLAEMEATLRERRFRMQRELQFEKDRTERLRALVTDQAAQLRAFGVDPGHQTHDS